jgi:hypothetical protein
MMALPTGLMVVTLLRMVLAGASVLVWWPRWALPPLDGVEGPDRPVADFARMALIVILVGYALAFLNLFAFVPLALVLAFLPALWRVHPDSRYHLSTSTRIGAYLLASLDHLAEIPRQLQERGQRWLAAHMTWKRPTAVSAIWGTVLLVVVGIVIWMRFWANWVHAALPYSDAYVVLVWIKSISTGVVFPGGVYPKGFHILAAAIQTLGAANPVVFEKFFGPAVGVLLALSTGYAAWRLSGRPLAGLAALILYGGMTFVLPDEVLRQAATDSQEFGNALVLPVAYFTYRAWYRPQSGYWVGAVSLLAVVALSHFVALVNAAVAATVATGAAWVTGGVDGALFRRFALGVLATAVAAVLPIGIPLLLGQHLYASSLAFLTGPAAHAVLPLGRREVIAGAVAVLALIVRLVRRADREAVGAALLTILLLAGAVFIQELPRFGLNSAGLLLRSVEFLALAEDLAFAMGIAAVVDLYDWVIDSRADRVVSALLAAAMVGLWLWRWPPTPVNPFLLYRIDPDTFVAAYVRLETTFLPGTWLAVSDGGGYALSVDQGYNLVIRDFVTHVDPARHTLRYVWPAKHITNVIPEPVFLFVLRRFYLPHYPGADRVVALERRDTRALVRWLRLYRAVHPGDVSVWFRSANLVVYEINTPRVPPP